MDPPLEIEQGNFGVPEGLSPGIEISGEQTQAVSGLNQELLLGREVINVKSWFGKAIQD